MSVRKTQWCFSWCLRTDEKEVVGKEVGKQKGRKAPRLVGRAWQAPGWWKVVLVVMGSKESAGWSCRMSQCQHEGIWNMTASYLINSQSPLYVS